MKTLAPVRNSPLAYWIWRKHKRRWMDWRVLLAAAIAKHYRESDSSTGFCRFGSLSSFFGGSAMRTFAIGWRNTAIVGACAAAVIGLVAGVVSARFEGAATAEMKDAGRELFVRQWTPQIRRRQGDGLGPVFNANSCVACHSQGGVGGGGDAAHNVTPTKCIRRLAIAKCKRAWCMPLRSIVVRREPGSGQDNVSDHSRRRSCDRQLHREVRRFRSRAGRYGQLDRPVRRRADRSAQRIGGPRKLVGRCRGRLGSEFGGDFQTIGSGRPRTLPGGRLGKFGWKAQFATLEEFVAAACANELGLGNPLMEQAKPLGTDYCCEQSDLTRQEFRRARGVRRYDSAALEVMPKDARQRAIAVRGKSCSRPSAAPNATRPIWASRWNL